MKTKITAYCFALSLLMSSCAKETFTFSNTGTSYGSKKHQKEVPASTNQAVTAAEMIADETAPNAENLTASTAKTIALSKKDFTKAKPLFHNPAATKEQRVSKVAQAKAAIKLNKEIKTLVKKAEKNNPPAGTAEDEGKSQIIALILAGLIGYLGIHRFYLGYTWQGVVQLLTLGGCGIWALIDLVRIAMGDLKPKDGDYTKKL